MSPIETITNQTTILQRGSMLVAFIDLFQSAVILFVVTALQFTTSCSAFQRSYWIIGAYYFCEVPGIYVFLTVLIALITYGLGVALLYGIRHKHAKTVKIWLFPNCILIGLVGVVAFCVSFTPLAFYAPLLSCLLVFRAYQCWIVAEMLYNDLLRNVNQGDAVHLSEVQQM